MSMQWKNWSGSLKFTPSVLAEPANEEELCEIFSSARNNGHILRAVGTGHSSSPLVHTRQVLVSLQKFKNVHVDDKNSGTAWVGSGATVKEAGKALLEHGLSLHNTGDVDVQTLAGAISTGTHGTGMRLQNLSSMLTGCRILCEDGRIHELTIEKNGPDFFRALTVSLGCFGIICGIRIKTLPAFRLHRTEWCTTTRKCLEHLDGLVAHNRNFDFYWYPRSDLVKLRLLNEEGSEWREPAYAKKVEDRSGPAIEMLPKERDLKFEEMEYAVPVEAGPACFLEVRKMILERFRKTVAWRVLYRTVKADDFLLSPCSGRDTVTISLHHNAGLPYWHFFRAIEPVFRHYGGRPHWGKKHTLRAAELQALYPGWNEFLKYRKESDPEGVFISEHLRHLLGV